MFAPVDEVAITFDLPGLPANEGNLRKTRPARDAMLSQLAALAQEFYRAWYGRCRWAARKYSGSGHRHTPAIFSDCCTVPNRPCSTQTQRMYMIQRTGQPAETRLDWQEAHGHGNSQCRRSYRLRRIAWLACRCMRKRLMPVIPRDATTRAARSPVQATVHEGSV